MKNSKRATLILFGALIFSQNAWAYHNFFFRSATDITSGILNSLRLDASSVTMVGPTIEPSEINGNPTNVSVYNAGSFLGNANTINVTGNAGSVSLAGSTATLLASANGFSPKTYNLYVGTPGTPGIDCTVAGSESFDAMYATVGVRGLLQTSTVTATIAFGNGIYPNLGPIVIPAKTSIYGLPGSTVVWYPSGTGTFLTIHGSLDNVTIDAQGRAVNTFFIKVGTGGYIGDGVKIVNAQNFDQTVTGVSVFGLNNTTAAYVGATVDGHAGCIQDNTCGGLIDIQNSQACLINLKERNGTGSTGGKQHMYVGTSTDIVITGDYQSMGERSFVSFGGNTRLFIGGKWKMARVTNTSMFFFRNLSFQISTGTVISATITIEATMAQPIIKLQTEAGLHVGPLITNTIVYNYANTSVPSSLIEIPANTFGTIVSNTHIFGMSTFCADSGLGTNCTGNGNTVNNKTAP